MASCERYEIEISAFVDKELWGAAALECVDHLLVCQGCREFYRDARGIDDLVDSAQAYRHISNDSAELWSRLERRDDRSRRGGVLGMAPAWAWRIAATLVAATALWLFGASRLETMAAEAPVVVQLGARPERMDEGKFVDMTRKLLESDRRYQRKMLEILSAVNESGGPGEGAGLAALGSDASENGEPAVARGAELPPSPRVVW